MRELTGAERQAVSGGGVWMRDMMLPCQRTDPSPFAFIEAVPDSAAAALSRPQSDHHRSDAPARVSPPVTFETGDRLAESADWDGLRLFRR